MNEPLARALAAMLRRSASLLPAGRRHWAEAASAEAAEMNGWPQVRWLAGGLWLVAREAGMVRRIAYGLGIAAVAAAATLGELGGAWFLLMPMAALLAGFPVGLASAWLVSGDEEPQRLREARIRQGQLAGAAVGAACGLTLTVIFIGLGLMLVIGPLFGLAGGTAGAAIAAEHPHWFRLTRAQTAAETAPS